MNAKRHLSADPRRRAAQRRGQGGAVILEGLWITWLLITIWGATGYIHELYGTKWLTVWESRAGAWEEAMRCDEGASADMTGMYDHFEDQVPPDSEPCPDGDDSCVSSVDGLDNDSEVDNLPDWLATDNDSSISTHEFIKPLSGDRVTFTTDYSITCNEPPFRNKELKIRDVGIADLAEKTVGKLFNF